MSTVAIVAGAVAAVVFECEDNELHSVRVVAWPHDRTVAGWVERGISNASSWQSMVTRISSVIARSRWRTRKLQSNILGTVLS